jgi:hypothetical protein
LLYKAIIFDDQPDDSNKEELTAKNKNL